MTMKKLLKDYFETKEQRYHRRSDINRLSWKVFKLIEDEFPGLFGLDEQRTD